ncbi:phosphoenolpyruvate-protein phosphotransferase [Chthoniobacter flavus Ellin428]|uniref:phosphoenolpyruvate--protein phosphotransferase n=1 Tax=Chthoniobacter flavus Ellin428 TaxID=497964 RepID=B4CX38_9BACT|nr:phosphoenolpyruvate--protein phosphotransferase [Chthoniobacter flavus]EDY20836.1 phosphoenolpyruvate-protein phosphotransferase [Chthoniobacter flavus Ellin428]TCO85672.1 phosphocarrier protein HPr /phosphoenolpyruvate--protein phosphotransferase /PTS system IIA component (Glc family) [Chthoniobacter flavus]
MSKILSLTAPLSGVIYPLERVPDPVFAQKLVGDGISIDPTDACLCAPCAGEVMHLHPALHAVTLRAEGGVEVLMHIGIDTVGLKGKGFSPRVKVGDHVEPGAPLIEFDLDEIATHAKSLLTEIIITNGETVQAIERASGTVKAGSDMLLKLTLANGAGAPQGGEGATVTSDAILIPNRTGLHARPAAVLANVAKSFQSEIKLQLGDRTANARSITSLMALEVQHGDKVVVVAKGADAKPAVEKLAKLIAEGLGDEGCAPAPAPATTVVAKIAQPAPRPRSSDPNLLLGVAASPGIAVGKIFQVRREDIAVEEEGHGVEGEKAKLTEAIGKARAQLEALRAQLHARTDPAKAAIFAAHAELLDDPDFLDIATSAIAKGKSAAFAWKTAAKLHAERLAALRNELLAQRANDVRDVGWRVLELLTGVSRHAPNYPNGSVLIAEDLTPSDTATMERGRVVGFATIRGGATSHVAILARSLDIPAIAGIEPAALDVPDGTPVILDAGKASLRLNPPPAEIERIQQLQTRHEARRREDIAHAHEPATTGDGQHVSVFANIGGVKDASQVIGVGGEGVGLVRSEFLFMDRSAAPSEDEQTESYATILQALGPDHHVIIRTLDVGGDKPLPYLPIPREDNPFLGERGIRVGLDRPEVLRTQLRALLRASAGYHLQVMFPMIATVQELRDAKAMLAEESAALGIAPFPCGIMVEVPAVAVMAHAFAAEADFFSIGTNDLTQYTLAMDRGHPKLAPKVDALNPAVLRLIAQTIEGAHAHQRLVGICGGIAGDPHAVPILVGLGIDELSVSLPVIPTVKAQIRRLNAATCRDLAQRALTCATAEEVRALVPEIED